MKRTSIPRRGFAQQPFSEAYKPGKILALSALETTLHTLADWNGGLLVPAGYRLQRDDPFQPPRPQGAQFPCLAYHEHAVYPPPLPGCPPACPYPLPLPPFS